LGLTGSGNLRGRRKAMGLRVDLTHEAHPYFGF